jgi:hypothetical protein
MEADVPLPCLQRPAIGPCPEIKESNEEERKEEIKMQGEKVKKGRRIYDRK